MKIGDKVYVRGCVDEIRQDTIIIRNNGGSFGTIPNEVVEQKSSEDCISRKRLRESLKKELAIVNNNEMYWQGWHDCTVAVETRITDALSVVPKRGEWIVYPLVDAGRVELECPICGDTSIRAVDCKPHFCENCGVRLESDDEE